MRHLFWLVFVSVIGIAAWVQAACVSAPDCTELGYNQSSCAAGEGILRCPFDTTKVRCIANFDCAAIGMMSACPAGSSCEEIKRKDGGFCYQECRVGYIYYSDRTCSYDLDETKSPIGVIGWLSEDRKHGLVAAKNLSSSIKWANALVDVDCLTNITAGSGGGAQTPEWNPEAKADRNGKENTACLVRTNAAGANEFAAAVYCNDLVIDGVSGWYLPAAGELYDIVVTNFSTVNTGLEKIPGAITINGTGGTGLYWTSTEHSYAHIWTFRNMDGYWSSPGKTNGYSTRCVLDF